MIWYDRVVCDMIYDMTGWYVTWYDVIRGCEWYLRNDGCVNSNSLGGKPHAGFLIAQLLVLFVPGMSEKGCVRGVLGCVCEWVRGCVWRGGGGWESRGVSEKGWEGKGCWGVREGVRREWEGAYNEGYEHVSGWGGWGWYQLVGSTPGTMSLVW